MLFNYISSANELSIVLLGLSNSGKTVITNCLLNKFGDTTPTIGVNYKALVSVKGIDKTKFNIFDMGGNNRERHNWKKYIQEADAIIFVIDSIDRKTFEEAKTELHAVLKMSLGKPCRILLSKSDRPDRMTAAETLKLLNIKEFDD